MKKFIFFKNSVTYSDSGKTVAAKRQEWDLIRALLWLKTLHWMDGFLIFESWRTKEQKQDYLDRFRVIANRSSGALKDLGLAADVKSIKEGQGYWQLCFTAEKSCNTNIEEAVNLLDRSHKLFALNDDSGWELVAKAMKDCPDPRSIIKAVKCVNNLPSNMELYAEDLGKIKTQMLNYRKILTDAIIRVADKASSDEKQGINFQEASVPLARWIIEILDINEVLDLFEGKVASPPSIIDESVVRFTRLVVQLAEYSSDTHVRGDIEIRNQNQEGSFDDEHEKSMLLKELSECSFVLRIAESVSKQFEETEEPGIERSDVYNLLDSALFEFAHVHGDKLEICRNVEGLFHRYMRQYVSRRIKGSDIHFKICDASDLTPREKKEKLMALLQRIGSYRDKKEAFVSELATVIKAQGQHGSTQEPIPHCLSHIKTVLEWEVEQESVWFRKNGPIAIDFKEEKVFPRISLRTVEKLVQQEHVSLLIGDKASGKTVLALNLGYELCCRGENVYYFDCEKYTTFDQSQLLEDIHAVTGIIIIDNIHLALNKLEWVYHAIKNDPGRHVLFVTRPGYDDFSGSFGEELDRLEYHELHAYDDIDDLIDYFSKKTDNKVLNHDMCKQIKKFAGHDLWMLSYVLKGCLSYEGEGTPKDWVQDSVKSDLKRLERKHHQYPLILISIAPIYQNYGSVAESFLLATFGFDIESLNSLSELGEIRRQETEQGEVFYGFPHASLADVYWEYGKLYQRRCGIGSYEDYLYKYISSSPGNGLKVLQKVEDNTRRFFVKRLCESGLVNELIQKEDSLETITSFIQDHQAIGGIVDGSIIEALLSRIDVSKDLIRLGKWIAALYKIGYGEKLWDKIDQAALADECSRFIPLADVGLFILFLSRCDAEIAHKFWGLLTLSKIINRLNNSENSSDVYEFFWWILQWNTDIALCLWAKIDQKKLAENLHICTEAYKTINALHEIFRGAPQIDLSFLQNADWTEMGRILSEDEWLWRINGSIVVSDMIDQKGLALRLCKGLNSVAIYNNVYTRQNFSSLGEFISTVDYHFPDKVKEFCKGLSVPEIVKIINNHWSAKNIGECIGAINDVDKNLSYLLCNDVDLDILAKRMLKKDEAKFICGVLAEVLRGNINVGRKLWNALDKAELVANILDAKNIMDLATHIPRLFRIDRQMANELWSCLDIDELAAIITNSEAHGFMAGFLFNMSIDEPVLARVFCTHFRDEDLMRKFTSMNDLELSSGIRALCASNEEIGGGIIDKLELNKVVKIFMKTFPSNIEQCLSALALCNPVKVKDIFQKFSLDTIATGIVENKWEIEILWRILNKYVPDQIDKLLNTIKCKEIRRQIKADFQDL